jgi:predicted nucleic acid-binding protein
MILIDAGPLVALLHADDRNHARCVDTLRTLAEPLATVWPALTEAMYLLSFSWVAQEALWEMLETEVFTIFPLDQQDMARMRALMKKYRDFPMDLADAALVRVAEREKIQRIFTLDRRDFSVYRPGRTGRFSIIP